MDLGLDHKACIVTGASRGIGLAVAKMLCEEGAHVVLAGRDSEALRHAAEECERAGNDNERSAQPVVIDVKDPDAGDRLVQACADEFGPVDVLVNNAGTSRLSPLETQPEEEWQEQWELHVMASLRTMRACVPVMVDQGEGRVVNVCSSAGKRPSLTNPAYAVTKAAQLSLSRVFADAYAAKGVLVNAVAPGPVASSLWMGEGGLADQMAEAQGTSRDEVLAAARKKVPLGRMGTESEVAAVIVFLCSKQASNVAGAAWSVDGGTVATIV